ncbi:MAG: leucine-rich repeat domain-containing protein [Candidatus Lokiarchaeota archaeon]|nr:leucine-rich repeat domain-containing protein [Candidatus Lokiarchaeota archaeon]
MGRTKLHADRSGAENIFEQKRESPLIRFVTTSWKPLNMCYSSEDEFDRNPYVIIGNETHPMAITSAPLVLLKVYPKQHNEAIKAHVIDRVVLVRTEVNWSFNRDLLRNLPGGVSVAIVEIVEFTEPHITFFWNDSTLDEWIEGDRDKYAMFRVGPKDNPKRVVYVDWTRNRTVLPAASAQPGEIDPLRHYIKPDDQASPAKYELDADLLSLLQGPPRGAIRDEPRKEVWDKTVGEPPPLPSDQEIDLYYRTSGLAEKDTTLMISLSKQVGSLFPRTTAMGVGTLGYMVEGNQVSGLGFFGKSDVPMEKINEFKALVSMNLSKNNLSALPDAVMNLTALKKVVLNANKLSSLPDSFMKLTTLQELVLSNNQFRVFPEVLTKMPSIRRLNLDYNQMAHIPERIDALQVLNDLSLNHNNVESVPDSIGRLKSLEQLHLEDNRLSALPESIGEMASLKYLHISRNQLSTVPDSIGKLKSLKNLIMSNMSFQHLPESITELKTLKWLGLDFNAPAVASEPIKDWIVNLKKSGCQFVPQ